MKTNPNPMGCRLCGIDQRGHAIQATADGSHTWTQPAEQQIKDRMLTREAGRNPSVADEPDDELACHASQYASLNDTYGGRSICGCLNCREYVADRESEDGC
jgi:hypothetical protein